MDAETVAFIVGLAAGVIVWSVVTLLIVWPLLRRFWYWLHPVYRPRPFSRWRRHDTDQAFAPPARERRPRNARH